jgi:hypothetical protein
MSKRLQPHTVSRVFPAARGSHLDIPLRGGLGVAQPCPLVVHLHALAPLVHEAEVEERLGVALVRRPLQEHHALLQVLRHACTRGEASHFVKREFAHQVLGARGQVCRRDGAVALRAYLCRPCSA